MDDKSSDYLAYDQRVIRVFVSSTFRDMQAERDELIKQTFPKLRKLCDERNVVWSEVDLRWGITQEQSERGEVLPICLAEIQRCRPYFIGLLGERYGWIPDEISRELIDQEKWLEEHLNHSVTELEILHGVLNDPKMNDHALFYFRDLAYLESLSDEEKAEFIESASEDEIKKYGQTEAEKLAEARKQKLVALKERIREHCEKNEMSAPQIYPSPKELGEIVWRDMSAIVEKLYPKEEIPDQLDRDAIEHEAFAQSRKQVYIGRQSYFDRLDAHAQSEDQPLVILGESGLGKSALLANWALQYREKHHEDLLVMHFIGATPYSADWAAMLRRIMGELKRRFDIQQEIPDKTDELKPAFANFLYMAAAKGRCVIILDALNQLEDRDGAPDLVWLDFVIPPNVRMILSTLPGRALDNLKERGLPTLQIEPLNIEERKQLIPEYLAQFSKNLDEKRAEHIANAKQTANPLFLRALLDELRVFGIHEKLDERIAHYLESETIDNLYEKILARYEQDYERERPALVKDAMSLIWASRRGLSEAELLDLLGTNDEPLPRAFWSPLYLAAESSLVSKSGLINFAHDYFREAVRDKYLATEEKELDARKIDEMPWHLAKTKSWQRLYELLADRQFFIAAWQANEFEIKTYWVKIEANSSLRLVEAYRSVLDTPLKDTLYTAFVGFFISYTGHLEKASLLWGNLSDQFRQIGDTGGLQLSLRNQAINLYERGELNEAMNLLKESEQICRELGNKCGMQASLENQAIILANSGKLVEAMSLHKESERICRELGNMKELSRSLNNQALILANKGELAEAIRLHKEQEKICRELGYKDGLSASIAGQALLFLDRGELNEAMTLYKESERICRELGNKSMLSKILDGQALVLYASGELDEAMRFHKESEQICRELGYKEGLSGNLVNQANILYEQGELVKAIHFYKESERIYRELGNKDNLSKSLMNQARILAVNLGRPNEALSLAEEAYQLASQNGFVVLARQIEPILSNLKRTAKEEIFTPSSPFNSSPVQDKQTVSNKLMKNSVSIPQPHPNANPERASQLNIEYNQKLAEWQNLSWWKRLWTKKPERPKGI